MSPLDRSRTIDRQKHEDLLKTATHVEHKGYKGGGGPDKVVLPPGKSRHVHTAVKQIHVPVERTVRVPVVKKHVERQTETKVVNGVKMVPVKKYRTVKETVLETKEEVVEGFREEWKKVKVPTKEVVKKQVPRTVTRQVPYVEYVPKEVVREVRVPRDVIKEKHGIRVDKHLGTKVMTIEEDHHYEMRPVKVKTGDVRVMETGYQHHGKSQHGRSQFNPP
eukprot:CAMPEP_0176103210 /NCGR_PEP_ID=MMETSP0120_2-20121206/51779_1 /TAXON_ID=160619 /ORGANISM="Kryptoperidinium foliaceum, Strain CCMP 1326" /LENGTH=219 /DNA_ID=CAMNT_0017437291 /DNA_START=18 /DNA_END=673 /DNA_ORIENTATION=-